MGSNEIALVDASDAMKVLATVLFALAVTHTFMVKKFANMSHKYRSGSIGENFFHFLGEVEVVFGIWAAVFISIWMAKFGSASAVQFMESVNFTEAAFVFVVMCIAATKPIMTFTASLLDFLARLIPVKQAIGQYIVILTFGTLLGSVITEPAAMTVCAFLLKDKFFDRRISTRLKYATIGLLFVNISIGGTLTNFAAPPVLMVAGSWGWTTPFMFKTFGLPVIGAVVISTILTVLFFYKEFLALPELKKIKHQDGDKIPLWMVATHLFFLGVTVYHSHHMAFFIPLFLLFLGWCAVTEEYQSQLRLRESLLVAFFLGGLVTLGKLQGWWLQPLIEQLGDLVLFSGAIALTAVTDNAALTYLGTLVPGLSDTAKYYLVAGAVTGGGLTVIANAPNPAGYGILQKSFGEDGINPLGLLLGAIPYTIIAALMFLI